MSLQPGQMQPLPQSLLTGQWINSGLLGGVLNPNSTPTTAASSEMQTLLAHIERLESLIKERTHIDVSKNQEERITELEDAVTTLMAENKSMKEWIERREQERCKEIESQNIKTTNNASPAVGYTYVSSSGARVQSYGITI